MKFKRYTPRVGKLDVREREKERDGAALESFVANLRNTVVVCSDLSVQISRHGPSSHL